MIREIPVRAVWPVKCWPDRFEAIRVKETTFGVWCATERPFAIDDELLLLEYDLFNPSGPVYTGRQILADVLEVVIDNAFLPHPFYAMTIRPWCTGHNLMKLRTVGELIAAGAAKLTSNAARL